jgi:hypothetical protein
VRDHLPVSEKFGGRFHYAEAVSEAVVSRLEMSHCPFSVMLGVFNFVSFFHPVLSFVAVTVTELWRFS